MFKLPFKLRFPKLVPPWNKSVLCKNYGFAKGWRNMLKRFSKANRFFYNFRQPLQMVFLQNLCSTHRKVFARFTQNPKRPFHIVTVNLSDLVANCKCLVDRWRCRHSSLLNKNNVFNSQNDKKTIMGRCLNIFQDWHRTWLLYFSMFRLFIFLPVYLLFWTFMSPTAIQFCIGTRFFRIL